MTRWTIRRMPLVLPAAMAWTWATAGVFKWYDDAGNVYHGDCPPPAVCVHPVDAATIRAVPVQEIGPPAPTVLVYSTELCPACREAKAWLRAHHVDFQERDVEHSVAYRNEFRELGGKGVPMIRVGDWLMTGFSARDLRGMLQL